MNRETTAALFDELRRLKFNPAEKPSIHENLLDILEIVAVREGGKPAHVNGQGLRCEGILDQLEQICPKHGFFTLRTGGINTFYHRTPDCEEELWLAWRGADQMGSQEMEILWAFRDSSLKKEIEATAQGRRDVSLVLGYPQCCVIEEAEENIKLFELFVKTLKDKYPDNSTSGLAELIRQDVSVDVDFDPSKRLFSSMRRFPFLQFSACKSCLDTESSPAAQANRAMRDIAKSLSPKFAREIEASAKLEIGVAERNRKASRPIIKSANTKTGRNAPCPCGSGKKYKKCCGR